MLLAIFRSLALYIRKYSPLTNFLAFTFQNLNNIVDRFILLMNLVLTLKPFILMYKNRNFKYPQYLQFNLFFLKKTRFA